MSRVMYQKMKTVMPNMDHGHSGCWLWTHPSEKEGEDGYVWWVDSFHGIVKQKTAKNGGTILNGRPPNGFLRPALWLPMAD